MSECCFFFSSRVVVVVLVLVLVVEGLVSPRFFFFFTGAVFVEETDRKKERHWEKGKRSPTISPTALTPTESDLQAGRRKSRPICSAELFAFLSLSLSHQARFECVSLVFLSISYVFFSVDFFLLWFFFLSILFSQFSRVTSKADDDSETKYRKKIFDGENSSFMYCFTEFVEYSISHGGDINEDTVVQTGRRVGEFFQ